MKIEPYNNIIQALHAVYVHIHFCLHLLIKTFKISEPGIDIKVDIKFAVNAQPCY